MTSHPVPSNGSGEVGSVPEGGTEGGTPTEVGDEDDDGPQSPNVFRSSYGEKFAFSQIGGLLEEKIQRLLKRQSFISTEPWFDLVFIQQQTCYSPDIVFNRRIIDHIVKCGIAHLFLRMWQSLSSVEYLLPDNVHALRNLRLVLSIVWNCTDKSSQLCESLVRGAAVHSMLSELAGAQLSLSNLGDKNRACLVRAYLGILHNIVHLCPDSRGIFRSARAVDILQPYLDQPPSLVRTKAFLILSYIISEEENDLINATDENVAYIIDILRDALKNENHFSEFYAFWASEITCGLNRLAANDSNKLKLVRLGAVPLYISLLRSTDVEEQSLAADGLWILSFHRENKLLMKHEPGCLEALQFAAANSTHEGITRAVRGALWVIQSVPEQHNLPTAGGSLPVATEDPNAAHVMISYHWGVQKSMILVKQRLRAEGYKVWMDIDNMSGSTLEAMALAIERAAVVLVCMSQGYKNSPGCRTEAEYTYRLHKDVIPLVLQTGYAPDGWLGVIVGARLNFDLSVPDTFDQELDRLVAEIGPRGKLGPIKDEPVAGGPLQLSPHRGASSTSEGGCLPLAVVSSPSISMHGYYPTRQLSSVAAWSNEEVQQWLGLAHLSAIGDRFGDFDGRMLLHFKRMMQSSPQFFYVSLENLLHLKLVEILRFSRALEELE